ncbi:hypothetical protein BOX15_Mlig023284g1 [Macrostomum lignano]|uniref:Uncharacterized protein n=1 Tax=Macrostomum lignano TaxID=282301 RepID=A0A267DUZ5_9PLAT|nr:hypothetical protein BOX15_Mlig023284g1 [Macrostomum lignano]
MQAAYLKPAVLRHHEVPGHFKEVFILSGYRPVSSSVAQCVRSIFSWNNETLNVWSHLLGSLAFLSMAVGAVSEFGVSDPAVWPLYLFLLASVLYPLASALAHMFNVLSREARDVCFFIDYAAIAFYGHCATCAYSAYSLPGHMMAPAPQLLLLAASTATAIWGVWTSCRTRFMPRCSPNLRAPTSNSALRYQTPTCNHQPPIRKNQDPIKKNQDPIKKIKIPSKRIKIP